MEESSKRKQCSYPRLSLDQFKERRIELMVGLSPTELDFNKYPFEIHGFGSSFRIQAVLFK